MLGQLHHAHHLPLLLRSECIVMDEGAVVERVAGGWLVLTPNSPGYWWGNALFMDRAPEPADLERWPELFRRLVHDRQLASSHMAFGWEGSQPGAALQFLDLGFNFFSLVVLSAVQPSTMAPPIDALLEIRPIVTRDWVLLEELMVEENLSGSFETDYRDFARLRIGQWRRLAESDQGGWFGAFNGQQLAGALGVYVEAAPDRAGRRLARFQNVLTSSKWRRQGVASALLAQAAAAITVRYAPSEFVIQAVRRSPAQRLYERMGYQPIDAAFGLEIAAPIR